MIHVLRQEQRLPISREEAWEFFSSPRNLEAITPEDMGFKIDSCLFDKMYVGQIISYRVKLAPRIWMPWVTEIKAVDEGRSFIDEQRFGPYKFWHHRHTFEEIEGGVLVGDLVYYAVPFWPFGEPVRKRFVTPKMEGIFGFRKQVLEERFGKMG